MNGVAPPHLELLRIDPRLADLVASLFWATFPHRRLGRTGPDRDGRLVLLVDGALDGGEAARWVQALDALLRQGGRVAASALLREVHDRDGRRLELLLPVAPEAYAGGAWLVGPFAGPDAADAWAADALRPPWVHDVIEHAGAAHADVFVGDPDARSAPAVDVSEGMP